MRSNIGRLVSIALCAFSLTACTNLTFDSSDEDSKLVLAPSGQVELERHALLYMSASFVFDFAEDPVTDAEWTSSDTTIATVVPAGPRAVVKALEPGTTTISATSAGVTKTIAVIVRTPHALSLDVAPPQPKVKVGQDVAMTAKATMSDGETLDVTSTADWTSMKPTIATVAAGTVHGVAAGESTITAQFDGKFSSTRATVTN